MKKKSLFHILMTDYSVDSRVRNETVYLAKDNYNVTVYCLKSEKLDMDELREGVSLKRFGLVGNKIITFLSAYLFMFFYSFTKKIDCVHAHDVNALPAAYLIAKIKRVPFIYDSHELWSQSHHSISSKIILNTVATMEKFFAKRAAQIITVSDSIKEYMKPYFKNENIEVIRNIPSYTHSGEYDLFREKFNIDKNKKICLYQGLISESRGVGLIAQAAINISKKEDNSIFFFLGDGPYLKELKNIVKKENVEDKILILGSIDQQELLKYTKSADIGIHAIYNSCLNHDYCLPNKLFEYIHSRLVLVMTDLTELKKFVEENKIGLTFEDNSVKSLEKQLLKLLTDEELFEEYRQNSIALANKITWDNEYQKLKNIYGRVC